MYKTKLILTHQRRFSMARLYSGSKRQEQDQEARKVFKEYLGRKTGYAWTVYPTSFGISVWVTDNPIQDKLIKTWENTLSKMGVQFTTSTSPKGNVYRIAIGKSQKNLANIVKATAKLKEI